MKSKKTYTKRRTVQVRRQRMTIGILTLIFVITISVGIGSFCSVAKDSVPAEVKYYKSVQIQKGDSLWSIAEEYMNSNYHSIYDYMEELVTLNQLDSHGVDQIQEGDYLTVAYYAKAGR